jgi:Fic/DOC family
MPKTLDPTEVSRLLERIGRFSDGVGVDELQRALRHKLSRRTLQRRLAQLVTDKRLEMRGAGRQTTYRLPTLTASATLTEAADTVVAGVEVYVPLRADSESLKLQVRRPLALRKPVGYDIEFLNAYEPNVTFYLDTSLREQLMGLGRAPVRVATGAVVAGTFARDILNRLLIDLSWASSALEGNTYSRLDTQRLIEQGQAAAGKDALETQMILNHKEAIEYLVHDADRARVDEPTLLALHALLSDGLLPDPMAGGRLRRRAVEIGGSVYRPMALPQRLRDVFAAVVERAAAIADPFEQSFFLMVHLPYLQPFEDMNKRVSRLAANIPFIRHDLSPLSFIDVPERAYLEGTLAVYELTRVELLRDVFVWAYERSCQQYAAVRSQLIEPDLFRLRHRVAIGEAIRTVVRRQITPTKKSVRGLTPASVPAAQREKFVDLVLAELQSLHAGNVVRFGVRPMEFEAWANQGSKK